MASSILFRYKMHHVLAWLVVYLLWFYLRYETFSSPQLLAKVTAIKVADLALVIYTASFLLVPRLLYKGKYALFGLAYLSLIFCTSILKLMIIGNMLSGPGFNVWNNFKIRFYDNILPHFLLASTGVAIKLLVDYLEAQKKMNELHREKSEAEIRFLKSQINPHFLFNSINSVYFLIDKQNAEARDALHRFSEILRYQLYESDGKKIPLQKELLFLNDFISLQKLRKEESLALHTELPAVPAPVLIEPLLLIPFVENAFKHGGYLDGGMQEISIRSEYHDNGQFDFRVSNTTGPRVGQIFDPGGIGLKNVQRRMELLYPGQHQLNIQQTEGWYHVHLTIQLSNQS